MSRSQEAMDEITKGGKTILNKQMCMFWGRKYRDLYDSKPPFEDDRVTNNFMELFRNIMYFCMYSDCEIEATNAIIKFFKIDLVNENELLDWLVEFEYLDIKLCFELDYITDYNERNIKSGYFSFVVDKNLYTSAGGLENIVKFVECFREYNLAMMDKYSTIHDEDFDYAMHENESIFSLKFHLKKRGMMDEMGKVKAME